MLLSVFYSTDCLNNLFLCVCVCVSTLVVNKDLYNMKIILTVLFYYSKTLKISNTIKSTNLHAIVIYLWTNTLSQNYQNSRCYFVNFFKKENIIESCSFHISYCIDFVCVNIVYFD